MASIVVDDHLHKQSLVARIGKWATVRRLAEVRPREIIKDDCVPQLLRDLQFPTFVTMDGGFWRRRLRDRRYCIMYFALDISYQDHVPALLRHLLRLPLFKTRASRMGTVVKSTFDRVSFWRIGDERLHRMDWQPST